MSSGSWINLSQKILKSSVQQFHNILSRIIIKLLNYYVNGISFTLVKSLHIHKFFAYEHAVCSAQSQILVVNEKAN